MNRMLALTLILFGLLSPLARADGFLIVHNAPTDRRDHFAFAPLEVSYHRVEVNIDDNVARTEVDQAFYNSTGARLEGTYIFPLPEGATIDHFSMDIDGRMTEAELLDAKRARETYEEIVRKYRDPALMEYAGRGAMKVRIFPIEPHSTKRIQIRYTQVLKTDSGLTEYLYPLNTEKFSAKPLKDVSVRVKLNSSTPIRSIYSPTHDVEIRRDGSRLATVGFEAKNIRPDIDFKLIVNKDPRAIGMSVMTYRDGSNGYFMLMASPGGDAHTAEIQPKDICFVIDTSGSMAGPKMDQAKKAINFCLANLNRDDRFEIVRFSTESETLFGKLEGATRANVEKATAFVENFKPTGGTAIEDALKKTQSIAENRAGGRPFTVVFLTDGLPTLGNTGEDHLVKLATSMNKAKVFAFGIGADVNTTLLDRMANQTGAISQYVLPKEDIEVKVSTFYTKIQSPVLTNLKLSFEGSSDVRVSQLYPNDLPDLFKGETLILFGKYQGSGEANVRLSGTLNGNTNAFTTTVEFARRNTTNSFIPRLWATRRVGWLLDEIRLRGETQEVKDEVTQLAREHGIVTPYTAYLIIEDERRRNVRADARTMNEIASDSELAARVRASYDSVNLDSGVRQQSGQQALDNSLALNSLKEGLNVQQSQQYAGMGRRGGRGADGSAGPMAARPSAPATQPDSDGYKSAQNYAQQVKVVNNKAFYQNGSVWTDNTIQTQQNLKKQEIKFNSNEYFVLLNKYPEAIPWFSLGSELDVVIDDTLYVVR